MISENDDIINRVLKWSNDIITFHLQRIFNVSLNQEYCSKHFRKSITIALRKSQKKFYSLVSSYRSIVLLNIISKIMKFILIRRINFLAKNYNLLSRTHFDVRKEVFTKHALHYMIERIHSTWSREKIIVIMLLDVMKAFDNIARQKLLHNLRIKRLNERLMRWINFFLSNKMTILKIDEFITQWLEIFVNTSQNSSLSSILFLFYNVSLLKKLERRNFLASDFVDDVEMLADDENHENCNETIIKTHEEICVSWALTHEVKFVSLKYQLIYFIRRRNANVFESIRLSEFNQIIKARQKMKYLRIIMNTKLNWKVHVNQNKIKALKSIKALRNLSDTTWSVKFSRMRQMMQTMFISQLTYACSIWYTSKDEKEHRKNIIKNLARVQYQIERVIKEAYKAISKKTLNIKVHSLFMHLRLDKFINSTTIRLITNSTYETIKKDRFNKTTRCINSLKRLENRFEKRTNIKAQDMKSITSFAVSSWWRSSIVKIMKNKKKIEKNHKLQLETNEINYIYIDENDINDKIRTTTISIETSSTISKAYLRFITSYTIYSTELYDIILTTCMRLYSFSKSTKKSKTIVCINNQTAIQAIHNLETNFDQYLMKWIIWLINNLRNKKVKIELHWISIHIDIENNEQIDVAIKQIIEWRLKERNKRKKKMNINHIAQQINVKILRSAIKITINRKILQQWIQKWRNCDKSKTLYKLTTKSSNSMLRLHENLSKRFSAIAIQLRTIKIDLQTFLYNRKQVESSTCSCRRSSQTIKHVLFQYDVLKRLRRSLWIDEIKKTKWEKLKLKNVFIDSINLKKTTKLIENSKFIDYLRVQNENDE